MDNKLLIIGNGFDLNCGLKSSFSNYIHDKGQSAIIILGGLKENVFSKGSNYYFTNVKNSLQKDEKFLEELTIFEKILIIATHNSDVISWSDVEKMLFELLEGKEGDKKNIELIVGKMYEHNKNIRKNNFNGFPIKDLNSLIAAIFLQEETFNISPHREISFDKYLEAMYKWLNKEVRVFEKRFMKYLKTEISRKTEYHENAGILFKSLGGDERTNILTFNYTPIKYQCLEKEMVHGSLGANSIIIGIDNTTLDYNNLSYSFSKTYRKVEKYFTHPSKRIDDVFTQRYDEIVFYGHSLNKQDYAYFQTLFDSQNIYESNIKLMFKYTVYDERKRDKIISDNISSIIGLIESYGETLDNKFKGKNLLHKLLNESRIIIEEVS